MELCDDIISVIITMLIKENDKNTFLLRCICKNHLHIAEKIYVSLHYNQEINRNELIAYIDNNKHNNVSFALFSNGFSSFSLGDEYSSFAGFFNPFELNIIGSDLLDNYYRCIIGYHIKPFTKLIEKGYQRVGIYKYIQTSRNSDISSCGILDDFDMRLYNWNNSSQYSVIPDIYTMYCILKTRRATLIDDTYPKQCVIKIMNNLYNKANNAMNIILVYFYFHLSCRVMNIPCKNTIFLDYTNILFNNYTNYILGTYIKNDNISSYNNIITIMTEQIDELYNKIIKFINQLN